MEFNSITFIELKVSARQSMEGQSSQPAVPQHLSMSHVSTSTENFFFFSQTPLQTETTKVKPLFQNRLMCAGSPAMLLGDLSVNGSEHHNPLK